MTAKEYLGKYRKSFDLAAETEQHLNELKAEAYQLKDHEGRSETLDAAVAKYMDACNDAGAYLDMLDCQRRDVKKTIATVQSEKLRKLLTEIYIYGKSLVRIAADRNQSYEHICRLHGNALNAVRMIRPDLE